MMRRLTSLLLAMWSVVLLSSCDMEASDNGRLDGFWHLEQVDTLATDGSRQTAEERLFWSFQGRLLSVVNKDDPDTECVLRFAHEGEELRLSEAHRSDRMEGDPLLEETTPLQPFGINGLEETFVIETLKGRKMVLRSKQLRLHLRKF